jgi:hypothetical protein
MQSFPDAGGDACRFFARDAGQCHATNWFKVHRMDTGKGWINLLFLDHCASKFTYLATQAFFWVA